MINRRLVLSVSLCAGLVGGCASSASPPASISPSAIASAVASPSASASASLSALPNEVDIEAAGALMIESTPSIDWVVVVDGRAWIAGLGGWDRRSRQDRQVAAVDRGHRRVRIDGHGL